MADKFVQDLSPLSLPALGTDKMVITRDGQNLLYVDASNILFSKDYNDLTNKPTLFSGAYADLTGTAVVALLASPAFTGSPTAPTPTAGDASTKIATTAFSANGANLTSGVIPSARLTGSYVNLTNATGSGNSQFSRFLGANGAQNLPTYTFASESNSGFYRTTGVIGVSILGTTVNSFNATGITGNGSQLTGLDASNISAGTLGTSRGGTGTSTSTGSGANVLGTSPTLNSALFSGTTSVAVGQYLLIGANTSYAFAAGVYEPRIQAHTTNGGQSGYSATSWSSGTDVGANLILARSDSGTLGSHLALGSTDVIGNVRFFGSDGSDFVESSKITATIDGTAATTGVVRSHIKFLLADATGVLAEVMRISPNGNVGIGAVSTDASLKISAKVTGAVSAFGISQDGIVQSDVTTNATYNRTIASTVAASFTTNITHYAASQGTIGAGSTVTSQYGFHAQNTLVGGASNFGFYADIASASGRWNFYANGTASNYFNGKVQVGSTTDSGEKLQVTGTSKFTGNVTVVGDTYSTNFISSSDIKLKENITPILHALATVEKLQGVNFNWKDTGVAQIGFIAQEVEKVLPRVVSENNDIKAVNYQVITAVLVEAIKELVARVEKLEAR